MRQIPTYISSSPHLGDYSANQYALDYTLGGKYNATVVAIGYCVWCGKQYAVAPVPQGWVILDYYSLAASILGIVSAEKPACISVQCQGAGRVLDWYSVASVVTGDGQWIHLGRKALGGG